MEPGTKLKCTDNTGVKLTAGRSYSLIRYEVFHNEAYLKNDEGYPCWYRIGRFEVERDEPTTSGYPDNNPKTAFGLKKPSLANVPVNALLPIMAAMADGAKKYGRLNWREKPISASVYFDAAVRHLFAWWDGEEVAEDSGVHHLGHAAACMLLVLDAASQGKLNDDRSKSFKWAEGIKALTTD